MKKDLLKCFSNEFVDKKIEEYNNIEGKLSIEQLALVYLMMDYLKKTDSVKYNILHDIIINKS